MLKVAPWPDYAGSPIRVGDKIAHPDGTTGVVLFLDEHESPVDQWRVDYGDGVASRLCFQIGNKGQAVVLKKESVDLINHRSIENFWVECGDEFDGCVIKLSSQAYDTFHKVFAQLSRAQLKSMGLTKEEVDIARNFALLY